MKKPRIDLGERTIEFYSFGVIFSPGSTIKIYDKKTEKLLVSMDPTELSAIYGAYILMREELKK